ncbi:MAG: hypothetical protein LBB13_03190 [Rickettsiales bacterium]|nr:hypothetical protein [Rickettsiales bacterium]
MNIIQNIQRLVYSQLVNIDFSESVNIYSCPNRNIDFPYILLSFDEYEISRSFNYNLIEVKAKIRIFDKNENNLPVLNITDDVHKAINELFNVSFEDFSITEVSITGNELKLYNEINSVWNNTLNVKLLAKQTF